MKKILLVLLVIAMLFATVSCDEAKHEHSYGTEWKYDENNHWHVCECGEKSEVAAHKYGVWEKKDDSTVKRTCSVCSKVEEKAGVFVASKDAFTNALKDNAFIVLSSDIDLANDSNFEIKDGKKVEIDLNGKTLTVKKRIYIVDAKVTLSGKGTLKTSNDDDSSVIWMYGSKDDATAKDYTVLTVGEGITIEGQRAICVHNIDKKQGGATYGVVVNLNGTTLNTKFASLYIQGKCTVATGNVPVFNIKDVKIKQTQSSTNADDDPVGIYAAGYGVWNIENTTVEGVNSAIEIRAGELNIKSGTFTASATDMTVDANGNGTTTKGAAIAVAQHTTKLPIKVKIEGGSFTGYHAMAVLNPQSNSAEYCKKVEVEVTGGSFTATGRSGGYPVAEVNVNGEYFTKTETGANSFTVTAKATT